MSVSQLRNELKARSINAKGLKSQLVARLTKTIKAEADKMDDEAKDLPAEVESDSTDEKKTEVCSLKKSTLLLRYLKYF